MDNFFSLDACSCPMWYDTNVEFDASQGRYIAYCKRMGGKVAKIKLNKHPWRPPGGQGTQESFATVGEIRVWWRADFQSGSRVLKKVFWTFSYLYLWHTMWFHAKKLLKTLKFWKSLNSLCKSGSRPQKSPKKAQKTDHSIAIYSNFWIGMVYFGYHLVNPHVQTVQNMYGKGG